MPIFLSCSCGEQFQTGDEQAGQRVRCPACGNEVHVPGDATAIQPPPRPRPAAVPRHRAKDDDYEEEDDRDRPRGPTATSGKAIASLILGVLSFCLPVVLGIPALILGILGLRDINRSRGRLRGQGLAIAGIVTAAIGGLLVGPALLIALLIPAVQKVREAAERVESSNNLHQLGRAMHDYHAALGRLPPRVVTDKNGRPLYSWRVAILPYLGEDNLYKAFKLDEPWDSPHNLGLLPRMPRTYAVLKDVNAGTTGTYYQVFDGPGAAFETVPKGSKDEAIAGRIPAWFPDGTTNTWLIVEAANPVPWTKPEDLTYDPNGPLLRLGGVRPSGFLACYADASVRFIPANTNDQILRAFITRNGGEVLPAGAP